MYDILPQSHGDVLGVHVSGKLTDLEYQALVPEMEQRITDHGRLNLLLDIEGIQGVGWGAIWEDAKFGFKHNKDLERIAVIGDKKWESWATKIAKPLLHADIRYFDEAHKNDAWQWLDQPTPPPTETP